MTTSTNCTQMSWSLCRRHRRSIATHPPRRSAPPTPRRTFERARWRSTRWLVSERSSALQTSSAVHPSTSRSVITSRCAGGSASMAACTASSVWRDSRRASGSSFHGVGGVAHAPTGAPPAVACRTKRSGVDGRPVALVERAGRGGERHRPLLADPAGARRCWRGCGRSTSTPTSGPSKPSMPFTTASQVSCTTSSALAAVDT